MKNIIRFSLLLLSCNIYNTSIAQYVLNSDTTYTTSFAFTDAAGDPQGYYLYKTDNAATGICVFQYTDGRKFVGSVDNGQPDIEKINRVYYPNSTIYIGKTPLSDIFVPAAVYYPDGSLFVGSISNYKDRLGFLFATDESYMMGRFWWKQPFNFVTTYFDKNHYHVADKYYNSDNKPEMDLEAYLKIQKKEKPFPARDGNEKVVWVNEHKKYKYFATGENIESAYIGWRTEKWNIGIGGFAWESYKNGGDTTRITNGISHSIQNGAYSTYTLPGYYATIDIGNGPNSNFGAIRQQWDTATMEFNSIKPKDVATNPQSYLEYNIRKDGSTYLGEASFNRANGYGIIYSAATGDTYFGDIVFGQKHGYGTLKYKDGSYVKGNWKNNEKFGMCKYYNAKGELVEEGDYVENNKVKLQKEVDLGYYAFVDEFPIDKKELPIYTTYVTKKTLIQGAVYTGNINKDLPEGDGELTMINGDVFKGKWHNGVPVGVCTIIYKPVLVDGKTTKAVYNGSVKNFRWEGIGHLVLDDFQFIGTFKDGEKNVYGTKVWPDGTTDKGSWHNWNAEGVIYSYDKNGNEVGYFTYINGIKNGDSKVINVNQNKEANGNYVNGKMEGVWVTSDRGSVWYNGKRIISLTKLGTVTYQNGVEISRQNEQ